MWGMESGGARRISTPSPRPSLHSPSPSTLQPLPVQHGRKDAGITACNGSVSPSRESQLSSSSLQLPLQAQQPTSASSSASLQIYPTSPSAVTVPHLPPPPRPLSSPSLSTLGTGNRSPSPKPRLRQAEVFPGHNSNRRGTSPIFGNSWTVRVENTSQPNTTITCLEKDYHVSMEHDLEDPQDAVKVKFLPQQRVDNGKRRWARLTRREWYLAGFCALLFVACVTFATVAYNRAHPEEYCLTDTCVTTTAQLLAGMDRTADPCEDFFQFACGAWNKKYVIPEDKHSYNTFEKLFDELQVIIRALLEEEASPHDSNATLKAKSLYRSCVNTTQISMLGDEPLREVMADLGGWPIIMHMWDNTSFAVEDILAQIREEYNLAILINCYVGPDDKDPYSNIIKLDQPFLGMPHPDYYLNSKPEAGYVNAYLNFMRGVVSLLGPPGLKFEKQLLELLEFEKQLANATRPQAERHDTSAMYNKMTVGRLQQLVPQIDWLRYLQRAVSPLVTAEEEVVVFAVQYLQDMMDIVQQTDSRTVANYLVWRVVMMLAPELTDDYQEVHNKYRMVLHGVKRPKIRWKKCVEYANERMGLAVGAMFIRDNFRRQSKLTALDMITDIREAFNDLLEENEWMDEEIKAVAKEKANAMNARIGYPDFITEPDKLDAKYEAVEFDEQQYFNNILAIKRFEADRDMEIFRLPVDRNKWEQEPAVVNAFYNPNLNDIVFPAGILQPLFYSEHFPKSLNYGGIGVVIGHEITHGFDDKGRQYDKDGIMQQWWDNQTIEAFRERTQCIIDQYSGFKLEQTGLFVDGKNTQGENIADNGGLKQAYRAYRKWVEEHGEESPLPGIRLNHDQLFFLNYAQIWCGITRDEEALHGIRTSVHSPGPIRVLGPLSNSVDFAKAYSCPLGSRMNPEHKCAVW